MLWKSNTFARDVEMLQIWRVSQWSQLYLRGLGRVLWGKNATCNPKFDARWPFSVRITLGHIIASYIGKKCSFIYYFFVNVTSLSFYWVNNKDRMVHCLSFYSGAAGRPQPTTVHFHTDQCSFGTLWIIMFWAPAWMLSTGRSKKISIRPCLILLGSY